MKNKSLIEGNGKHVASEAAEMLVIRTSEGGTNRAGCVVSIVEQEPVLSGVIRQYIEKSSWIKLGLWCKAALPNLRQIALSSTNVILINTPESIESAIQSVYLLKNLRPALAVVVLEDQPKMANFLRLLQAGADGFFKLPGSQREFEETIHETVDHWKPFSKEIRKSVAEHLAHRFAPRNGKRLTQAEAEVLLGLVNGKRDKEIASDRQTTEGTVHSITHSLYKKLRTHSRSELVQRFLPLGETYRLVRRQSNVRAL